MRLACSTASFPQERPDKAIARVAWAGYEGVELHLETEPLPAAEALQERLRAGGLELAAVHAGSLPPGAGAAGVDELGRIGRVAALARALDASLVVTRAPGDGTLEELAASLELLDRALGGLAMDVCLVNTPGTLLAEPAALAELWRRGLPERVGIALDPARALLAGWDPAALDLLPELPRHVYLNDALGGRIVPAGEGELEPERLLSELRLRGYGGSLCLLLENADPWQVEPLARELREAASQWLDAVTR